MPRLSTPLSSSGADEDDLDSPIIMDEYFGDEAQDIGGNGSEEEPAPATTASDLADGEDSEDDVDQIRNELLKNSAVAPPPKQQGIKRKRGRPTKAETMARKTKTASKSDSSSHRRSGRIVAKVKSETEKAAAAQPAGRGRPKKGAAPKPSPASQRRGKKVTGTEKVGRSTKEKEWDVESIVAVRTDAVTKEEEYFVKWKGYPSKDNTWEPRENLKNCQGALEKFEVQKKETKRGRSSKKVKTAKVT